MTRSPSAAAVGPNGVGPWQNEEARSSIDRRIRNRRFRVIPVLLPGHTDEPRTMPPFLRRYAACDLRAGLDDHHEFARLLAGIHACGHHIRGDVEPAMARFRASGENGLPPAGSPLAVVRTI